MDPDAGFSKVTADRMKSCVSAFRSWLESEAQLSWASVVLDPQALAYGLRAYGLYCFEKGLPRYLFVYAITGVQDQEVAAAGAWLFQVSLAGRCHSSSLLFGMYVGLACVASHHAARFCRDVAPS